MFEALLKDSKKIRQLMIIAFILLIVVYPIMAYFFLIADSPTDVFLMGQISFNADVLRDYYFRTGNLNAYRTGQYLDYGFMCGYGLLLFSLSLFTAKKYEGEPKTYTLGQTMAICAIFAPLLDALENGFILLTLDNPFGFDDWYAIFHSILASAKWILLIVVILWNLVMLIKWKTQKK